MHAFLSKFSRLLLILVLMIASLLLLFPKVVSSDWGRKQIIEWINLSIPGKIEIDKLSLNWSGDQSIEGITLRDREGRLVFKIKELQTETSLWSMLALDNGWNSTKIEGLEAFIHQEADKSTNLQRALGLEGKNKREFFKPIQLTNGRGEFYLSKKKENLSFIQLNGSTNQSKVNGSFSVNVKFNALNEKNKGLSLAQIKEILAKNPPNVRLINFPVDLIDESFAIHTPSLAGITKGILGDFLDLSLESSSPSALELKASSANLKLETSLELNQETFVLRSLSPASLQLNPETLNPFLANEIKLVDPTFLRLTFEELGLPFQFFKEGSDLSQLFFKGSLLSEKMTLKANDRQIITLTPLSILFEASLDSQLATFTGQTKMAPFDSSINFSLQLEKPKNFSQWLKTFEQKIGLTLEIKNLPLHPFSESNPKIHSLQKNFIGEKADIDLNYEGTIASLSFHSDRLAFKDAKFKIGKEIKLLESSKIEWQSTFFKTKEILLNTFKLLFNQQPLFELDLTADEILIPLSLPRLDSLELKAIHIYSSGNLWEEMTSKTEAKLSSLADKMGSSPLLETPLKLTQSVTAKFSLDDKLSALFLSLHGENQTTYFNLDGHYKEGVFYLDKPLEIESALSPKGLEELSKMIGRQIPKIKQTAMIDFKVSPGPFAIENFRLSDLEAKGVLSVNQLAFVEEAGVIPVFEELSLNWSIDAPKNALAFNLEGLGYGKDEEKPSEIEAYVEIEKWLEGNHLSLDEMTSELHFDFTHFPTAFLSFLVGSRDLSPILGPSIDIDLKTKIDKNRLQEGYWDLSADSSTIHLKTRLKLEESITLFNKAKPSELRITLTPENFDHFKTIIGLDDSRTLRSAVTLYAKLSDLSVPYRGGAYDPGRVKFSFSTSQIQWNSKESSPFKFEGNLSTEDLQKRVDLDLSLFSPKETLLTAQATFFNPLQSQREVKVKLESKEIPTKFAEDLLLLKKEKVNQLEAFFGKFMLLSLESSWDQAKGIFLGTLKGERANIAFDAKIQKGILTLNKPLEGYFQFSQPVIETFLGKNPALLNVIIGSENPLTFSISPENFNLPLQPFALEKVKIDKASLNPAKVHVKNEGDLQNFLSLITPIRASRLILWFTPVYLSLNKGILDIKRFDALVGDSYQLAFWGTYDLLKNKGNFILGLPLTDFAQLFRSEEKFDGQSLLHVPFQIENDQVNLDKGLVTGKLSAALAKLQSDPKTKLIGSLAATLLGDNQQSSPEPTSKPFPWTKNKDSPLEKTKTPNETETIKKEKKKKSTKKQLQEGASKALELLSTPLKF